MIGKNAVSVVEQAALNNGFLMPEIPVGDTYPSWDGEILVYKSEEARNQRMKTDLLGRLPVQVKGHHVDKFSVSERSETLQVADLINYSNDAGVFYLVVEMLNVNDSFNTKIFYSELLKYDIEEIIKGKEHQQTIVHRVKELPLNRFYSLCKHFLLHRKEQGYKYVPWNRELEYEEYSFTVVGNQSSDIDYFLFESGTYIYGIKEESHTKETLGRFTAVSKIEKDNLDIGTINRVHYTQIYREKTKDSQNLKFGNGFTISLQEDGEIKFNFTEKGTLKERIKDCEFFLEVLRDGKIYINDSEVLIDLEKDVPERMKETLPEYLQELKNILSVFNQLGVEPKEDFETLKSDFKEINYLIRALVEKSIDVNEVVKTNLQLITVGNYNFILAKGVGKYKDTLFNLFDYKEVKEKLKILVSIEETFDNSVEHTPYISIKPDMLFECDNLQVNSIKRALMDVDYTEELALEATNQYLLRCLFYIDDNKNSEKNEILVMIADIYQHLYHQTDTPLYFINQMQAIYRFRDLNKEEIKRLTKIKMETYDSEVIKCAIDILLGNKSEFWYRIERLPETDRDNKSFILDYPIYNLLKDTDL